MTSSLRLAGAAFAVGAVVGGGAIWSVGQSTNPSPSPSTNAPIPSFASAPTASPSPSQTPVPSPDVVTGWPSTVGAGSGLYSWDGSRCAGTFCSPGFMHNGNGSGDVTITIQVVPEEPFTAERTAVPVAGHSGWYRRIVEPQPSHFTGGVAYEEWIVEIDGAWVTITMYVRPGARTADLGDAHAIIRSMRAEPSTRNPYGFRLVFRLTNGEWDSG